MIVISSKAFNIFPLILSVKESLNEKTVSSLMLIISFLSSTSICYLISKLLSVYQIDPYLKLVDDCRLQVVSKSEGNTIKAYGSREDDEAALKTLSCIVLSEGQSKTAMLSVIVQNLQALSEVISHRHFYFLV